jgi:flagellar assembly factor FliW
VEIKTSRFGVIEIEDDKLLTFPFGIIGYPEARTFSLIGKPENAPYYWLQCVNQPELSFVVAPLLLIRPDYDLHFNADERLTLRLEENERPLLLGVVVIPEDPMQSTINLLAPVVINERSRLGWQIINDNSRYRTRHVIKDELSELAKEGEKHAGADAQKEAVVDAR